MSSQPPKCVLCVSLLVAFAITGYVVGWYVGASQTPVVGTAIPLLTTLLGTLSFAWFAKRSRHENATENLKQAGFKVEQIRKVADAYGVSVASDWLPISWAGYLTSFMLMTIVGTEHGVEERIPPIPPVNELLGSLSTETLTTQELTELNSLRWKMREKSLSVEDAKLVFSSLIVPTVLNFEDDRCIPANGYGTRLTAIKEVIAGLNFGKKPVVCAPCCYKTDAPPPSTQQPVRSEGTTFESEIQPSEADPT